MATSPKYFDPQTLAKLAGLELRARTMMEGYVSGVHKSPLHGFSIEFAEHREYAPGDDLRYVDWKVFGKTDKFYLKQYEEETNLVCYLLLDTSESMRYCSDAAALSKLEYAQCAAAALAYLVLQQQDSIGLATFDDVTAMMAGLKHFRHRRHEVVVFHVLDPAELDFPFRQTTLLRGLEGLPDVLTDPRSLRRAYLDEFGKFQQAVRKGCRAHNIDYVLLRTDQPLDVALTSYLASRMTRVK